MLTDLFIRALYHGGGYAPGAPAALLAATRKVTMAMIIGVFFLIGGAAASAMVPAPLWFSVLDLAAAYLPMAWLGAKLATRRT